MKRIITALALVFSTFATGSAFAETPNSPPNEVDVSRWDKWEELICYDNGIKKLNQDFFTENGPAMRLITRISIGDKVVYEYHFVYFDTVEARKAVFFSAHYAKTGNMWINYGTYGKMDALTALQKKNFPNGAAIVDCEK